jgi:hypothetical protein
MGREPARAWPIPIPDPTPCTWLSQVAAIGGKARKDEAPMYKKDKGGKQGKKDGHSGGKKDKYGKEGRTSKKSKTDK